MTDVRRGLPGRNRAIDLDLPENRRGFLALAVRGLILLSMMICIVVPHAFQAPTAALLVVTGLMSLFGIQRSEWLDKLLALYCAGTIVTIFYLWIGYSNGAPLEAVLQVMAIYIGAPLLWLVVGTAMFEYFTMDDLIKWLIRFNWLAFFSVVAFFYAFFTFGRDSVKFLTEDANVNVQGGFAGASIIVYGSLIFLAGAFFSEPTVVKSTIGRLAFPAASVVCALTSGRSALILAIPIGYIVGVMLRSRLAVEMTEAERRKSSLLPMLLVIVASFGGLFILSLIFVQLDLLLIFDMFVKKISSGGGYLRVDQSRALWEGIEQSYGLGIGHGRGVRYLRSDEFPWRYEIIPLASMLRVGIIGTIVYTSPFILYTLTLFQRAQDKLLTRGDIYMAGGFYAMAAAAFTNPYIESFIFQWMFFVPVVSLGARHHLTR